MIVYLSNIYWILLSFINFNLKEWLFNWKSHSILIEWVYFSIQLKILLKLKSILFYLNPKILIKILYALN